jgi:hypothetical protein
MAVLHKIRTPPGVQTRGGFIFKLSPAIGMHSTGQHNQIHLQLFWWVGPEFKMEIGE